MATIPQPQPQPAEIPIPDPDDHPEQDKPIDPSAFWPLPQQVSARRARAIQTGGSGFFKVET